MMTSDGLGWPLMTYAIWYAPRRTHFDLQPVECL